MNEDKVIAEYEQLIMKLATNQTIKKYLRSDKSPIVYVSNLNIFLETIEKLKKIKQQYESISKKPRNLSVPELIDDEVDYVVSYKNTSYSTNKYSIEQLFSGKMNITLDDELISVEDENVKLHLGELKTMLPQATIIIRKPSVDFRCKLRNNGQEVKRLSVKKEGLFFENDFEYVEHNENTKKSKSNTYYEKALKNPDFFGRYKLKNYICYIYQI